MLTSRQTLRLVHISPATPDLRRIVEGFPPSRIFVSTPGLSHLSESFLESGDRGEIHNVFGQAIVHHSHTKKRPETQVVLSDDTRDTTIELLGMPRPGVGRHRQQLLHS